MRHVQLREKFGIATKTFYFDHTKKKQISLKKEKKKKIVAH